MQRKGLNNMLLGQTKPDFLTKPPHGSVEMCIPTQEPAWLATSQPRDLRSLPVCCKSAEEA